MTDRLTEIKARVAKGNYLGLIYMTTPDSKPTRE